MLGSRCSIKTTSRLSDGRIMTRESSTYRGDVVEARFNCDANVSIIITLTEAGRAELTMVRDGTEERIDLGRA
jgi:hypothetical protein